MHKYPRWCKNRDRDRERSVKQKSVGNYTQQMRQIALFKFHFFGQVRENKKEKKKNAQVSTVM